MTDTLRRNTVPASQSVQAVDLGEVREMIKKGALTPLMVRELLKTRPGEARIIELPTNGGTVRVRVVSQNRFTANN